MPWCSVSVKSRLRALTFIVFGAVSVSLVVPISANALDNDVGVSVCGGTVPPAQVAITQPVNDSIVNQPNVTFRGTVAYSTQVETSIDGQYNSTVSIGPGDSSFQTDIALPAGTHTIKVIANALCGGQSASSSVVITYTPAVDEPSSGSTTPTEIAGQPTIGLADSESQTAIDPSIFKQVEEIPVVGSAISAVSDFAAAIGLESAMVSGGGAPNIVVGTARVGLTVAAITSVVMATTLAPMAATAVPGVSELFNVSSQRSMMYLGWIIRGAGVLTMAVVYFI